MFYIKNLFLVDWLIKVVVLGFFWGWFFCGLVYSVLVWLLGFGDVIFGVLFMVYFGLGILFVLIGIGIFSYLL